MIADRLISRRAMPASGVKRVGIRDKVATVEINARLC